MEEATELHDSLIETVDEDLTEVEKAMRRKLGKALDHLHYMKTGKVKDNEQSE